MTIAKLPLPSLRFVIYAKPHTVRLIPQTTPRGRVLPGLWALPGGRIENTDMIVERCKQHGWRCEIVGNDGSAKRGRRRDQ